jgi:primary-amine oxidase
MALHPLDDLTVAETNLARKVVLEAYPNAVVDFREIFLAEPPKAQLQLYLNAEHQGSLTADTPRPARQAKCHYDVIGQSSVPEYHEALVGLLLEKVVEKVVVDTKHHASLTM